MFIRETLLILFLYERSEHILLIENDTISENNRCLFSSAWQRKRSRTSEIREKPFVVPKALKAEGKKDKPKKNLNLNCLLILSLFSCNFSVKSMSTFHVFSCAKVSQINFLFNYPMHYYNSLSHQKHIYNIY